MKTRFAIAAFLGWFGAAAAAGPVRADTADGSCMEAFELANFQPLSPSFGQPVSSGAYRARTTVVMLLASW